MTPTESIDAYLFAGLIYMTCKCLPDIWMCSLKADAEHLLLEESAELKL